MQGKPADHDDGQDSSATIIHHSPRKCMGIEPANHKFLALPPVEESSPATSRGVGLPIG